MLDVPDDVPITGLAARRARASASEARQATTVAFAQAVSAIRRRKWPLIVCIIAIPLIAFVALKQVTPRYTATGTVIYEPETYAVQELQSILRSDPLNEAVMASQVEVVRSLTVAARVTDKFHLMDSPEFNWTLRPPTLIARLTGGARDLLARALDPISPPLAAVFARPAVPPKPSPDEVRDSVIRSVQDAIQVRETGESHLLEVSFTTEDQAQAADEANAVMDFYITDQLAQKFDAARTAGKWLEGRAQELRREVRDAEDKIAAYKARMGITQGVQAGLDTEQVSRISADLVQARNDLTQAQSRLDAARGNGGSAAQASVAPSVVQLRAQRDALVAQMQSLRTRLGPRHPDVVSLRNQINAVNASVDSEIARVVAATQAEVQADQTHVASLESALKGAQASVDKMQQAEIPLNAMQRDADAARTLLQAVLTRIQQTTQQNAIEQPDARVISQALPPVQPSFPKTKLLVAAATMFGLMFGLLIVYLLEISDSTFRSGEDARGVLGLPCFALVPIVRSRLLGRVRIEDYVVRKPLSPFAEQMRALRAGLWLDPSHPRIVAITAARPGEAKTTTAIALGRTSAMSGERVLVLDCDVRQPSFGRLMRAEHSRGIVDHLLGLAPLEEIIRRDRLTSMDYIPAGTSKANSLGLFMSEGMRQCLERLRQEYDLVLLDAPPVFAMTDARIVSRTADATLLCIRWRETPRSVVSHSLELLDEAEARVIGVALTRVDPRAHVRAGHADSEVYHPRYGGYYRD